MPLMRPDGGACGPAAVQGGAREAWRGWMEGGEQRGEPRGRLTLLGPKGKRRLNAD